MGIFFSVFGLFVLILCYLMAPKEDREILEEEYEGLKKLFNDRDKEIQEVQGGVAGESEPSPYWRDRKKYKTNSVDSS